jgi:hypothetical protein
LRRRELTKTVNTLYLVLRSHASPRHQSSAQLQAPHCLPLAAISWRSIAGDTSKADESRHLVAPPPRTQERSAGVDHRKGTMQGRKDRCDNLQAPSPSDLRTRVCSISDVNGVHHPGTLSYRKLIIMKLLHLISGMCSFYIPRSEGYPRRHPDRARANDP